MVQGRNVYGERWARRAHYPWREVIGLNVSTLGYLGGSIHCATQQMPQISYVFPENWFETQRNSAMIDLTIGRAGRQTYG
ncbi:agmatine deiminase family protein [Cognatishimia sp. WU-CL00825]|uniref:agmatine deiminase family protein n=1 Tax=Cognatishimia sp. WU-CL00825 TaxID=3127658 RepID=UPI003365B0B3